MTPKELVKSFNLYGKITEQHANDIEKMLENDFSKNIGMLRQYLNERTSDKPITNKELETFLME